MAEAANDEGVIFAFNGDYDAEGYIEEHGTKGLEATTLLDNNFEYAPTEIRSFVGNINAGYQIGISIHYADGGLGHCMAIAGYAIYIDENPLPMIVPSV